PVSSPTGDSSTDEGPRTKDEGNSFVLRPWSFVCSYRLQLDFDIHARRQVQPGEQVNRLTVRIHHVNQPLVGADFKVLLRVLVDERAAGPRKFLDAGGQWTGPHHFRARALGGLDDALG